MAAELQSRRQGASHKVNHEPKELREDRCCFPGTLVSAIVTGIWLITATVAAAQSAAPRVYQPNAADEDWTFLKSAPNTDIWDPLKYIALGPEDWSLTLSGEFRLRPEGFRIRRADGGSVSDSYLLQRYLVGFDLRMGPKVRVFGELQSGLINGQLRSPRPTDRNSVDVHQAFVEARLPVRQKDQFAVVAGRQELEIGSSRLISASPGLNVKRSFDGVKVSYRSASWVLAGAVAQLTSLVAGSFDDRPDPEQVFWGVAAGRRGPALERSDVGIYYLGIDRNRSFYAQGQGKEARHTVGAKWYGVGKAIDLNYDGVFQWGRFADASIRAWGIASETGFRFGSAWRPRASLRIDVASGDRDAAAAALQSFNPLFPGNSYSGAVGLLGPTNLTDLTPAVTLRPRTDLTFSAEAPSYWRTSTGDGVYATDLRVLFGPAAGTSRYVGTNPGIVIVWQPTRHLQLQGAITRFMSGGFLEETFVSEGFGFYSFTARYRF